mmetsp:Transcript_41851/g.87389  ORF Transcript_41851/g.87389 Transcript_41851/m.87389 type:complete len:265 (+) Transcript_41851:757-1551(+)
MSHGVEKGQDVVNAIVRCGSVRVLRKHHQVHVLCHKLMTPKNFVVDVLQPRLHRGLGCLSDVRALGQSDWLRCLRGLGPNKWVHPAEVVANLLLRLLQTALVHLLVEGIVLQKVAEDRLAVLLVHFRVHDVGLPGIKDHLGGQGCLPHAHQHEELPVLISGPLRLLDFVVPLLDEAGDDCIQVQGGGLLGQKLELCPALAHQRSSCRVAFRAFWRLVRLHLRLGEELLQLLQLLPFLNLLLLLGLQCLCGVWGRFRLLGQHGVR